MKTLTILASSFVLAFSTLSAQDNDYAPFVAVNTSGDLICATWTDFVDGSIYAATNVSGTWNAPVQLPGSTGTYDLAFVMIDPLDNVITVWGNGVIGSAVLPSGGTWTATSINSSMTSQLYSYPVMDSAGNVTIVWLDYVTGIFSSTLPVGSTTWSTPVQIDL